MPTPVNETGCLMVCCCFSMASLVTRAYPGSKLGLRRVIEHPQQLRFIFAEAAIVGESERPAGNYEARTMVETSRCALLQLGNQHTEIDDGLQLLFLAETRKVKVVECDRKLFALPGDEAAEGEPAIGFDRLGLLLLAAKQSERDAGHQKHAHAHHHLADAGVLAGRLATHD